MNCSYLLNMKYSGHTNGPQRKSLPISSNTAITLRETVKRSISIAPQALRPSGGRVLPIPTTPAISVMSIPTAFPALTTQAIRGVLLHASKFN